MSGKSTIPWVISGAIGLTAIGVGVALSTSAAVPTPARPAVTMAPTDSPWPFTESGSPTSVQPTEIGLTPTPSANESATAQATVGSQVTIKPTVGQAKKHTTAVTASAATPPSPQSVQSAD